jgi:hypothetical protein
LGKFYQTSQNIAIFTVAVVGNSNVKDPECVLRRIFQFKGAVEGGVSM